MNLNRTISKKYFNLIQINLKLNIIELNCSETVFDPHWKFNSLYTFTFSSHYWDPVLLKHTFRSLRKSNRMQIQTYFYHFLYSWKTTFSSVQFNFNVRKNIITDTQHLLWLGLSQNKLQCSWWWFTGFTSCVSQVSALLCCTPPPSPSPVCTLTRRESWPWG